MHNDDFKRSVHFYFRTKHNTKYLLDDIWVILFIDVECVQHLISDEIKFPEPLVPPYVYTTDRIKDHVIESLWYIFLNDIKSRHV